MMQSLLKRAVLAITVVVPAEAGQDSTRVNTPIGFEVLPPVADANPAVRHQEIFRLPTRLAIEQPYGGICPQFDSVGALELATTVGFRMITGYKWQMSYYVGVRRVPLGGQAMLSGGGPLLGGTAIFHGVQDSVREAGGTVIAADVIVFETDVPAQHMWRPERGRYRELLHIVATGALTVGR